MRKGTRKYIANSASITGIVLGLSFVYFPISIALGFLAAGVVSNNYINGHYGNDPEQSKIHSGPYNDFKKWYIGCKAKAKAKRDSKKSLEEKVEKEVEETVVDTIDVSPKESLEDVVEKNVPVSGSENKYSPLADYVKGFLKNRYKIHPSVNYNVSKDGENIDIVRKAYNEKAQKILKIGNYTYNVKSVEDVDGGVKAVYEKVA